MTSSPPPRPTLPTLTELDLVIRTPRLVLRPYTEDDVDAIVPIVSDPEFPKQMSWTAHSDRAETVAWARDTVKATAEGKSVTWAIVHAGQVCGCIALEGIRWEMRAWRVDRAEIGYWLAPALWGQGLMSEAALAVVRWGFEELGLHKITIGCLAENPGSRRVIEKTGFRFIGRLEDDVWRDGAWRAHLRYELTTAEWSDVHTTLRVTRPE